MQSTTYRNNCTKHNWVMYVVLCFTDVDTKWIVCRFVMNCVFHLLSIETMYFLCSYSGTYDGQKESLYNKQLLFHCFHFLLEFINFSSKSFFLGNFYKLFFIHYFPLCLDLLNFTHFLCQISNLHWEKSNKHTFFWIDSTVSTGGSTDAKMASIRFGPWMTSGGGLTGLDAFFSFFGFDGALQIIN